MAIWQLVFPLALILVGITAFAQVVHSEKTNSGRQSLQKLDYDSACRDFIDAANEGDAAAMTLVGTCYENGQRFPKNEETAAQWYRRSAEAGNTVGMRYYADMLFRGRGISRNFEEAARWYSVAAEAGDVEAQYQIALLYAMGIGVPADPSKATD
ncbi:MAG TPA: tetratricopeptide repeat protein, partial [Casimicrobiaceae bacterium]|nr:tetratricopeptide repeat protein [Casimicrobiaceae bacterium]